MTIVREITFLKVRILYKIGTQTYDFVFPHIRTQEFHSGVYPVKAKQNCNNNEN